MDFVKDINLDDNFDLFIKDGDFDIEYSDINHIEMLLLNYFGSFKQFPLVGMGIKQYQAAAISPVELKRLIKIQLLSDNYTVQNIKILNDFNFNINAIRNLPGQ